MKKLVAFVLVLAVVAAVLVVLLYKKPIALAGLDLASFVPANTVAFVQFSDVGRSRARWKKTGVYQILHEPEVRAFLEKPKTRFLGPGGVHAKVSNTLAVNPRQAFAAVTDI